MRRRPSPDDAELVAEPVGDQPYTGDLPHAGSWTRPTPDDGLGVRCDAHGLLADEHEEFGRRD